MAELGWNEKAGRRWSMIPDTGVVAAL